MKPGLSTKLDIQMLQSPTWNSRSVYQSGLHNHHNSEECEMKYVSDVSAGSVCGLERVCGGVPSAQALVLSCGVAGAHGEVHAGAAAARFSF